ncbi:P-loop containing nucleoside triphosphate hydrolase protein [Marasmius fiardii PR-910]|nr:P-loop containing nucleoside triphosphate hydrolase protein [Marasmius fiardii PR-910]
MSSTEVLTAFISRQRHLLALERAADLSRSRLLLTNCPPKQLEKNGLALLALTVVSVEVGLGGKVLVELGLEFGGIFPPNEIRTGDLASIEGSSGSSHGEKSTKEKGSKNDASNTTTGIEGVIYKINATRVVVALNSDRDMEVPERCRLVKVANTITYDRMDKAIDQLEEICVSNGIIPGSNTRAPAKEESASSNGTKSMDVTFSPLFRVLLGLETPSRPDLDNLTVKNIQFFDESLNESQKEAVKFCLASKEVACIHGPPGTGKTHTLIELIQHLVSNQNRILICGASNLAVDNILERLVSLPIRHIQPAAPSSNTERNTSIPTIDFNQICTRIGHPARVLSSPKTLDATLDARAARSDQAELLKDVKKELEGLLGVLTGKKSASGGNRGGSGSAVRGRGSTKLGDGSSRGKGGGGGGAGGRTGTGSEGKSGGRPKGAERKKMWEEVKALRKEHRQRSNQLTSRILSFTPSSSEFHQQSTSADPGNSTPKSWTNASLNLNPSQIVLATCHSAGTSALAREEFDVVVIDEATQALEAVTWIPILQASERRPTKLILAGDPMQLGPTVLSVDQEKKAKESRKGKKTSKIKANSGKCKDKKDEKLKEESVNDDSDSEKDDESDSGNPIPQGKPHPTPTSALKPPNTLETTLFDRLEEMYGSRIKRMLEVQYRMNKRICEFPSQTLYGDKLKSDPAVAGRLLSDIVDDSEKINDENDLEDLNQPVMFYDTSGLEFYDVEEQGDGGFGGGSRYNENEALVVKQWVGRLIESGIPPSQIAVITPYQAQVTLLTSLLRPLGSMEIGTVDGMQGREKDAVIISLVRSNEKKEVGFLSEKRRLNVAMTRAKRHLCIVGDSSTVARGGKYLAKWMEWLEVNADVRYPELN